MHAHRVSNSRQVHVSAGARQGTKTTAEFAAYEIREGAAADSLLAMDLAYVCRLGTHKAIGTLLRLPEPPDAERVRATLRRHERCRGVSACSTARLFTQGFGERA